MDKVQFKCQHCDKMMAVGTQLLGKAVSCPNCKKVVTAPATAPGPAAPPPAAAQDMPMFKVPDQGEMESIFSAPDEDDPFDGPAGRAPTVEMPAVHAPTPAAPPGLEPTAMYDTNFSNQPANEGLASAFSNDPGGTAVAEAPAPGTGAANARALAAQRSKQDSLVTYYVLVILIPYAIGMTLMTIYFWNKSKNLVPIEQLMPDWPRDQQKPWKGGSFTRLQDDGALPASLMTALGKPIKINDLEITPVKVEQKKIKYEGRGAAQPSHNDALVLTLNVKNMSDTYSFAPNDLAYNRYVPINLRNTAQNPYTCLIVGDKRYYGGPTRWPKQPDKGPGWRQSDPLEWIQGTEHKRVLKPGEEMTMIVVTNPDIEGKFLPGAVGIFAPTEILDTVQKHSGSFTWRVQLRTGVLELDDDRIGSVTSLFGVTFNKDDIKKG